jgi:hypothetical protein
VPVQEFRSSGVQEFRSSGVQEFRSSGVQAWRNRGIARIKLYLRIWEQPYSNDSRLLNS